MAVECSCCRPRVCACVILDVGWLKVKVRNFSLRLSCPPSIVLLLRIPSSKVLLGWAVAAKKKTKKPSQLYWPQCWKTRRFGLANRFFSKFLPCVFAFYFLRFLFTLDFVVFSFDVVGLCRNEKANNTSHPSDFFCRFILRVLFHLDRKMWKLSMCIWRSGNEQSMIRRNVSLLYLPVWAMANTNFVFLFLRFPNFFPWLVFVLFY